MAVQAQYPSNILLLNRSVVGEGENDDCSLQLQSQPGGNTATSSRFVDDPSPNHILFTDFPVANGGLNQRKRRREINMNQLMNSLLHQQQFRNQIVESRNVDVSTGLRLSFNDQQQLQQQHSISSSQSWCSMVRMSVKLHLMLNSKMLIDGDGDGEGDPIIATSLLEASNLLVLKGGSVIQSNANLGVHGQGSLNLTGAGNIIEAQHLVLSIFCCINILDTKITLIIEGSLAQRYLGYT